MASIFQRIFKVTQSEAHASMDKLEDPIKMSEQGVRSELEPMGFDFVENIDFLPWQHILIFSLAD